MSENPDLDIIVADPAPPETPPAEPVAAEPLGADPDPTPAPAKRRRAAAAKPEVNAPADGDDTAFYVSANEEPSAFTVAGIDPFRQFSSRKLVWVVAGNDTERFERHHHFVVGRVVRAPDTFVPEQF